MTPLSEKRGEDGGQSTLGGKGYSRADVRYFSLLLLSIIYSLSSSIHSTLDTIVNDHHVVR